MTTAAATNRPSTLGQYYALTKPRVVQLIVFCALIGMVLAVPGLPNWSEVRLALLAWWRARQLHSIASSKKALTPR